MIDFFSKMRNKFPFFEPPSKNRHASMRELWLYLTQCVWEKSTDS